MTQKPAKVKVLKKAKGLSVNNPIALLNLKSILQLSFKTPVELSTLGQIKIRRLGFSVFGLST